MGKVKLLLNVGTCFSATSPFHFTVSLDQKCVYTGHVKEHAYLLNLMVEKPVDRSLSENLSPDKRPKPNLVEKGRKPEILTHRSKYIVGKWTKKEESQFFDEKLSLDNYIAYYLKHWENCKQDYEYVGDFSNHNALLSIPFMQSIKNKLLEHFDVKITMQFRDPVRRLFSVANKLVKDEKYSNKTPIQLMHYWLSGALEPNAYYSSIYRKYAQVWGVENVRAIVMEDLWNPDTQKQELEYLSDFLGYKFTKVHENAYYPYRGSNAPKYEYLVDQWSSDWTILTNEQYKICASIMKPIYTEFKKTFGYIPQGWNNSDI